MVAPEVPPLCRETLVSRTANVGTWLRKRNGGQKWVNFSQSGCGTLWCICFGFCNFVVTSHFISSSISWTVTNVPAIVKQIPHLDVAVIHLALDYSSWLNNQVDYSSRLLHLILWIYDLLNQEVRWIIVTSRCAICLADTFVTVQDIELKMKWLLTTIYQNTFPTYDRITMITMKLCLITW